MALPLVCQLVVHLNRISNFQLIFLTALPASRAFIIARNTLFTSLQSQVANIEIGKRACAVARRLHSPLQVGRVRQVKGEKQKVCNKAYDRVFAYPLLVVPGLLYNTKAPPPGGAYYLVGYSKSFGKPSI